MFSSHGLAEKQGFLSLFYMEVYNVSNKCVKYTCLTGVLS